MNIQSAPRSSSRPQSARIQIESLEPRCLLSVGELDPTFRHHGLVVDASFSPAVAMLTQRLGNGKTDLLVADANGLQRFTGSGALDTTFAHNGRISFGTRTHPGDVHGIAQAADGHILIAGPIEIGLRAPDDPATNFITRLTPEGAPDTSFGPNHDGTSRINGIPGHPEFIVDLVGVQRDGKIIAVGNFDSLFLGNFPVLISAVIRLNTDGSLDSTFGTAGVFFPAPTFRATRLTVQRDGRLTLDGFPLDHRLTSPANSTLTVSADGQTSTLTPYPVGQDISRNTLNTTIDTVHPQADITTSDGKRFAAGGGLNVLAVARLNADNSPDLTFGFGGTAAFPIARTHATHRDTSVAAVATLPDGSIVVAGGVSGKLLLAKVQSGAHAPRNTSPIALSVQPVRFFHGTTDEAIHVGFSGESAIDVSSFDDFDVVITGPKGFAARGKFVNTGDATDALDRSPAYPGYSFPAPGGFWDATDNGDYAVTLRANQVFDITGKPVAPGLIGTFHVKVR